MRALILSDIHGNLPALEAVLQQKLGFDEIWNLGDTVGYGPWPNECASLVRSYAQGHHLAGNHDLAAVGKTSTEWFNSIAAAAAAWTIKQITMDNADWIRSLGSMCTAGEVTLAHGSPRDPAFEYVTDAATAADMFDHFLTRHCFVGHTHRPMIVMEGVSPGGEITSFPTGEGGINLTPARVLFNPGSVGQPRDGDPRAACAIYDSDVQGIVLHRIEYPVIVTQRAIERAGLPLQLAHRLGLGR